MFAGKENKKLGSGEQFLAGFGAGVLEAIFAVTPIETVKTKAIQTNSPFMQGVKNILKTEGPGGLYQGVWATIAKQGSNQVRVRVCVCVRACVARVCALCFSALCAFVLGESWKKQWRRRCWLSVVLPSAASNADSDTFLALLFAGKYSWVTAAMCPIHAYIILLRVRDMEEIAVVRGVSSIQHKDTNRMSSTTNSCMLVFFSHGVYKMASVSLLMISSQLYAGGTATGVQYPKRCRNTGSTST